LLSQEEIVPYLLDRGLVSPRSVVDGDLRIVDVSRRNRNYKVLCARAPSLLLKQGLARGGAATVAHEAAFYGYVNEKVPPAAMRRFVPGFRGYDARERLLVLEFVDGSRDLRSHHLACGAFPKSSAAACGRALAALHALADTSAARDRQGPAQRWPPWVLSLHRPNPAALRELSAASIGLVKVLQQHPALTRGLDDLRESWRPDCLIHNDVRWDNWLVTPVRGGARVTRVKLIDFELSGWGDPCCDVGSMFGEYLNFWVESMPITGQSPPARWPELASYPLERMQPALAAFWRAYADARELEGEARSGLLGRAVRFAPVRLVQSAYEHTQHAAMLTANVLVALQLALNILQRPAEACRRLLGIAEPVAYRS
jgi:aminoglycoside phosphotransferase (APT) family kinase protein